MGKKESPKETGISSITGRIIQVRHATEADMGFIIENLQKHNLDTENLNHSQFVVAMENGNPIGFGRIKKTGETYEIGCVVVIEKRRKQGIGSLIIKHLIDFSPVRMVYVVTDIVNYFKKLGFVEAEKVPEELVNAIDNACKISRKQNILMVYEKDKM